MLRKRFNKNTKRIEYALVSRSGKKVLEWFGRQKPSKERFDAAESRVQYFKHQGQ